MADGHFLDGELDAELRQALLDQDGGFLVEHITGIDRYSDREALRHLRLSQFLAGFGQIGFIGPQIPHIATDIVGHTAP